MQPARIITAAAIAVSLFIVWRLLVGGGEDVEELPVEKFAAPEAKLESKNLQFKPEAAKPIVQPIVKSEVIIETVEDQSCHYEEMAKNITSAVLTIIPSANIVESCVEEVNTDKLVLFKPIICPQPSYFDRSYREYTAPSHQSNDVVIKPGDLPETVHYIWCGNKPFRFENYLSIISAAKLLQPHKLIFHYNYIPMEDAELYNTWFQELKQSLSSLELKHHEQQITCEGGVVTDLALTLVTSQEGGVYIGETTLLTKIPLSWKTATTAVHPEQATQPGVAKLGLLMAKPGVAIDQLKADTVANAAQATTCHIVSEFNQGETSHDQAGDVAPCVVVTFPAYPRDVMDSTAPMVSLARWIYYATASKVSADQNSDQAAPKIGHVVAFSDENPWSFYSYLSALSALHISGIERLYVYGDKEPEGEWWTKLEGELITFVPIDKTHTVFQRPVKDIHHKTDILRYYILWKYGGVYMEQNTVWVNAIPMENWQYPAVVGLDWMRAGDWPQYFNMATLMAKPGANFLKLVIDTFRYYLDDDEDFNKVRMPYRVYEQHPRGLHIDDKFTYSDKTDVICWQGICHPAFHKIQAPDDKKAEPASQEHHDLSDFSAFHFKAPKIPPSLESYATIKAGDDMFAQIGKKILEKSDRLKELEVV